MSLVGRLCFFIKYVISFEFNRLNVSFVYMLLINIFDVSWRNLYMFCLNNIGIKLILNCFRFSKDILFGFF